MFKLKIKNEGYEQIAQKLNYIETSSYQYVLCDDVSLFEDDKINILFQESDVYEISKMMDQLISGKETFIVGHNEFGQKRVNLLDVLFFEAMDHDVTATLEDGVLYVKEKLYQLEEDLDPNRFIRVHKSFIVNVGKIAYIRPLMNYKLELEMENGSMLEVSRTYIKAFKQLLKI